MARIGNNPLRNVPAPHQFGRVVLCVITHLPVVTGYHAKRLEVVQKCLTSMRDNAGQKCDVFVWDNGSGNALRDWLQYEYKPAALVLSENVGKSAARLGLLGMVTPETVVNISDDDIYYSPNWLTPQVALLTHVPDTACVTGYPVRTSFRWANTTTIERLTKAGAEMRRGLFIPELWEYDFCTSIGRDYQSHLETSRRAGDVDVLCKLHDFDFYATSHHCQHIGYAGILRKAALSTLMLGSMPDEKPYDLALDALGNRIATTERLTRHIGNVIDDDLRRDMVEAEKW